MTIDQNQQHKNETATAEFRGTTGTSSHNNHDYYNNIHAAGRVRQWSPEDGDRILEAYLGNVADHMTMGVAHMIEAAYQNGLEVDEIIQACEETGFAPRPSPAYLRKILENWVTTGVTLSKVRHYNKVNRGLAWWKPVEPPKY